MEEIKFGSIAGSALLMLGLRVIYMVAEEIPNRIKRILSLALGVGISLFWIAYTAGAWEIHTVTNAVIYGLTIGLAAIGAYEVTKRESKVTPNRE